MNPPRAGARTRSMAPARGAAGRGSRSRDGQPVIGRVLVWGIALYAVFGSVFWLPGVPLEWLAWTKYGLFGGLLFLALVLKHEANPALQAVMAWLAATALGAFISLTVTSGLDAGLGRARDLAEPFLWLFILSTVPLMHLERLLRPLFACLLGFGLLAAYPVAAAWGWVPDFQSPLELHRSADVIEFAAAGMFNVSDTGFTGKRTGWGASLGLAALCLAILIFTRRSKGMTTVAAGAVVILFALVAANTLGARGAVVGLAAAVGWWMLSARRARTAAVVLVAGVAALSQVLDLRSLLSERFWIDARHLSLIGQLDALSTGRLTTYIAAWQDFTASPIFGVGPLDAKVLLANGQLVEVHNIALLFLAEGGLVAALPLLGLGVMVAGLAVRSPDRVGVPDGRALIVFSLVLSMLEPGHPIGSFQNTTLFWLGVWLATLGSTGPHGRAGRAR